MKRLLMLATLMLSAATFAQEVKMARESDLATKYTLKANGDLFRTIRGNECQVTNNVESLKISQHPNDAAVAYFQKDGDLYALHNADYSYPCPKTSKKMIMSKVDKYTVVSNTKTVIVNMALSKYGNFVAWDNARPVVSSESVDSYVNNTCYGSEGKSFNTYVAFARTYSGKILKIRGGLNGESVEVKTDNNYYYDIASFKNKNNVCN